MGLEENYARTDEREKSYQRSAVRGGGSLAAALEIAGGFLLPSVVAIGRPHRTNYRLGSCSWVPLRVAWIGGEALLEHAADSSLNRRTIPTTASTIEPFSPLFIYKRRKDIFSRINSPRCLKIK